MLMVGYQVPTPTRPQQRPENHQQIPTLKMNTSGIPLYHICASAIREPLTQATMTAGGDTQESA